MGGNHGKWWRKVAAENDSGMVHLNCLCCYRPVLRWKLPVAVNRPLVARTSPVVPVCVCPLMVDGRSLVVVDVVELLEILDDLVLSELFSEVSPCVLTCNFNVIMLAKVVVCLSVMVKLFANVLVKTELVACVTLLLAGVRLMLVTVEVAAVMGLLMCYSCVTDLWPPCTYACSRHSCYRTFGSELGLVRSYSLVTMLMFLWLISASICLISLVLRARRMWLSSVVVDVRYTLPTLVGLVLLVTPLVTTRLSRLGCVGCGELAPAKLVEWSGMIELELQRTPADNGGDSSNADDVGVPWRADDE